MNNNWEIQPYSECNLEAVRDIFNHYITHSYAAFSEDILSLEAVKEMMDTDQDLPTYIVVERNEVIGFAFAYRYHWSKVFSRTVKFTYFILPEHTQKGIGKALLDKMEHDCRMLDIDNALVHISSLNEPSLRFHKKYGFKECGRFCNVGKKFNKNFDDVWMQKVIFK